MRWGTCRWTGLLILGAIVMTAGCSAGAPRWSDKPVASNLLFGRDGRAVLATQIGRSAWPATHGWYEGPADTLYLEDYRDFQGDASLERSNPRRVFRSYRIGTQHR